MAESETATQSQTQERVCLLSSADERPRVEQICVVARELDISLDLRDAPVEGAEQSE